MRLLRFFSLICLPLILAAGCAKERYQIGREDPDKEIQKCVKLSQKKLYAESVECLEIFKSRFPNTAHAKEAALRVGDTYFLQKQYLLAADTYLHFIKLNPLHPQTEYAYYRAGLSYFKEAPKSIDRDPQYLHKAKEILQEASKFAYQETYQKLIEETLLAIDERLAERLFYIGRFYHRTGEHLSAVPRLEEMVTRYPKSPLVPKGLYFLTKSYLTLGKTAEAQGVVGRLVTDYPNAPWTKKAQNDYLDAIEKK